MAASTEDNEEFPSELQDRLGAFDDSLAQAESVLNSLFTVPHSELQSKLTSLDQAKLDLVSAYAINSLFWMYLNVKGENPKEHGVKQELDRIRSYMTRVKEIQEKEKAPKIDQGAAKRFVRSALWQQAHSQTPQQKKGDGPPGSQKRSKGEDGSNKKHKKSQEHNKKHKKPRGGKNR